MKTLLLSLFTALTLASCNHRGEYYKLEKRDFKVLHINGDSQLTLEDVKTQHVFDNADLDWGLATHVGDTVELFLGQRDNDEGQIIIEPVHPSVFSGHRESNLSKSSRRITADDLRKEVKQDSVNRAAFSKDDGVVAF